MLSATQYIKAEVDLSVCVAAFVARGWPCFCFNPYG